MEHRDETPRHSLVARLVEVVPVVRTWAVRLRKGSRGGRPPGFDGDHYKKRNTVERAINRLKQHWASPLVMTSAAASASVPLRRQS